MSAKSILRRWLAEGEVERTIKALQRIAENSGDGYFMDEVILVSGRYSGLQKERRKGLIGDEPFRVESAKIRDSLLSLAGEVPADAVLDTDSSQAGIEQAADAEAEGEPENKPPNPKSLAERPEPSSPAQGKGRSWFFGIGINRYPHFSLLHNAVKDVQDICRLLQEEYGLAPEHTITLFDEEATRENIIARLDELARLVTQDDKLLIYYSGHGHLNETTGRGFWIPHDARKQNTSQYIHNSIVKEYLEDINSLHTLLISDACFSGTLFYRGEMKGGEPSAIEELERRKSRWALCSGRHDEQVYDGEPGGNSPFAAGILDSLQQPGRAVLHVAKLADEVVLMTRANYRQTPEGNPMFGLGHKGGQYVFRRQNSPPPPPDDPGQEGAPAPPLEEGLAGRVSWPGKGRWILGFVLLAVVIVVLGLVFRQKGLPGLADLPEEGAVNTRPGKDVALFFAVQDGTTLS